MTDHDHDVAIDERAGGVLGRLGSAAVVGLYDADVLAGNSAVGVEALDGEPRGPHDVGSDCRLGSVRRHGDADEHVGPDGTRGSGRDEAYQQKDTRPGHAGVRPALGVSRSARR